MFSPKQMSNEEKLLIDVSRLLRKISDPSYSLT